MRNALVCRAEHAVDEEARESFTPAAAADLAHEGGARSSAFVGFFSMHHFHQHHLRHGIEETEVTSRDGTEIAPMSASLRLEASALASTAPGRYKGLGFANSRASPSGPRRSPR
jgi:hypothetical protein